MEKGNGARILEDDVSGYETFPTPSRFVSKDFHQTSIAGRAKIILVGRLCTRLGGCKETVDAKLKKTYISF